MWSEVWGKGDEEGNEDVLDQDMSRNEREDHTNSSYPGKSNGGCAQTDVLADSAEIAW